MGNHTGRRATRTLTLRLEDVRAAVPKPVWDRARRLKWELTDRARRRNRPITALQRNLLGDRDIEWSWVSSRLPSGPGRALDFGNGGAALGLIAAERGFQVVAVDLEEVSWPYRHPNLDFIQGDILDQGLKLGTEEFDLVINCSTVEHVGLVGRYAVRKAQPDGDLDTMGRLRKLMKPEATMLLTIPVGIDAVFQPMTRVYGERRLPLLLGGFTVIEESFWAKDPDNRWRTAERGECLAAEASAGSSNPLECIYALGCFRLQRRP
jgi:hypothetical protein